MQEFLLSQGLPGIVILGLSIAVLQLWKENQRLNDKIREIEDNYNQRFISMITTTTQQSEQLFTALNAVKESLSMQKYLNDKFDSTIRRLSDAGQS